MTAEKKIKHTWYFLVTILLMPPLMGMGIDLYIPSLPWIVKSLHTNKEMVQLTIAIYLAGNAAGALFFGVVSDNHGRKRPLIAGIIGYVGVCLLIIAIPNIWALLTLRFLQGFFTGATGTAFRAMITDAFEPGTERQQMTASCTLAWSLGPIIAPFIGGYLQHYFNWQANFVFYIGYVLLLFVFTMTIPETHPSPKPMTLKAALGQYRNIFSHGLFWVAASIMGLTYGMLVIFNVIGPFLIQTVLHFSPIQFGHLALLLGTALFVGSSLNRFMLSHYTIDFMILLGVGTTLLGAVILLLLGLFFPLNIWLLIAPLLIMLFFVFNLFSACMSLCLSLFPQAAGMAGAAMAAIFLGITGLMGTLATLLKVNTQIPLAIVYIIVNLLCLLTYTLVLRRHFISKT
ncbi:MAG: multidrug effflux MFS transporter [Desulfobacteraceae bacterium]|nr:multidrug effflux MFS transporter [Desulfobacteraceae bacterium]